MTKEQAKEMLQAKLECLENTISPKPCDCECIECDLEYRQGNMGEQKQALEMAIKALEQTTSDNCVSREKVWYMITGGKYANEDYEQFIDRLVKELENMPPVTPTQSWIPVNEELPKENGWYQCTVILNDLPRTMDLFYKNGKWLDNRRINMFDTYDIYGYGNTKEKHKLSYQELISEFEWNQVVIAWSSSPQPYEEKRGNENGSN